MRELGGELGRALEIVPRISHHLPTAPLKSAIRLAVSAHQTPIPGVPFSMLSAHFRLGDWKPWLGPFLYQRKVAFR